MKKKWLISILVGIFLMAFAGSAFAWSGRADVDGKPVQFYPGGPKGYYIWQDEHGFHIWTTTRGEEHVFSGAIRTDGRFYHVRGHRLEDGDSFNIYSDIQERFWFKFSEGDDGRHFSFGGREVDLEHDKIHFKLDNAGGSDGINFRIKDASYIDFDLFVDGHPIPRSEIHIGDSGWHPVAHNFRLNQ